MKKSLKVLSLLGCLALTACAPGKHLHVTTQAFNLGQELGPEMTGRNLIATIGYDEDFVTNYRIPARSTAYLQGVVEGTPEYQLRVVHLSLALLKGFAWYGDGEHG